MTIGRKRKLSPELTETICKILHETGSAKLAYEAAGISHETYHRYLREIPEFSEKVQAAHSQNAKQKEEKVWSRIQAAEDWLDRLFKGEITKTTTRTTIYPDGSEAIQTTVEEIIPQHYHLERTLGKQQPDQDFTFQVVTDDSNEEEVASDDFSVEEEE